MMKKISYLLGALLVVLLACYLLRYQTCACICDTIPADANAVVQIKLRSLEKHLLHNFLSNPLSYMEKENSGKTVSSKKESRVGLLQCIDIPKSLIFYKQEGGKGETWTSAEIKIKDLTKFKKYLLERDYTEKAESIYSDDKNVVVVNEGRCKLIHHLGEIELPITDNDKSFKCINSGNKLFESILESDGDFVFRDTNGNHLDLITGSGEILVNGQYAVNYLNTTDHKVQSDGMGALSAQVNLPQLLGQLNPESKKKFANFTKLNLDSLAQYVQEDMHAVLHNYKVTQDTIVTYEYDDNFNKVEVKDIKESVSPDYSIALGMSAEGVSYMKRQKAIIEKDGQSILAIMPLVTTYCEHKDDILCLYTNNNSLTKTNSSDRKLDIALDISEYQEATKDHQSTWQKNLKDLESVALSIDKDNKVTGLVKFKSTENPIVSFMK